MLIENSKLQINSLENSYITLIGLFGLLMPFSRVLNVNSVILVLIVLLSVIIRYQSANKQFSKKKDYSLWSLILFFIIVSLSLFYTKELKTGLKVTSRIIPIFLLAGSFLLTEKISKESLKTILKYYSVGCLLAIIYCFVAALFAFNESPLALTEGFTYFTAPLDFHPSYFGIYTIFAFCIYASFFDLIKKKIVFVLTWILLLAFLFFLRSRAPIIIFFFITLLMLYKKSKRVISITIVLILATLIVINRLEILTVISNGRDLGMTINERLNIWMNSLSVIKEHLVLGVGIGDFQAVLDKQYFLSGFEKGIDHRYNNHNQFLQTFMSNGLIGLVSLSSIFLLMFQKAMKSKHEIIYYFLTCTIVLMLFESILMLQHGIYFFAFFASVLLKANYREYEI